MLSDDLRSLALWLRARRHPVEVHVVVRVLDELVEEAVRLEAHTKLDQHETLAERVSTEGIR